MNLPVTYSYPGWLRIPFAAAVPIFLCVAVYGTQKSLQFHLLAFAWAFVIFLMFIALHQHRYRLTLDEEGLTAVGAFGFRFKRPYSDIEAATRNANGHIILYFRGWSRLGKWSRFKQKTLDHLDASTMVLGVTGPMSNDAKLVELLTNAADLGWKQERDNP